MKKPSATAHDRRPLEECAVTEVMTHQLLTVSADDTVLMAWELMRRGKYHHLPVVTEDGCLLGVLDTESVAARWHEGGPDSNRGPVSALLRDRWCISVKPDDSVATAAQVMMRRRTDVVAVTDPDGRLLGLLTARDLVAALSGAERHDTEGLPNAPSLFRIEPVMPPAGHPVDAPPRTTLPPD
jgi:CBS domain-containing membrane protein